MFKFSRILKVKQPERGTSQSAGIDVFIPENTVEFVQRFNIKNDSAQTQGFFDNQKGMVCIHPHGRINIPTGLRVEIEDNTLLFVANKSGVSWVDRVTNLACIVDRDYTGEVFITLHNFSSYKTTLMCGAKLIQLVHLPILIDTPEEVPDAELHVKPTERGAGAMGSTGV